MDERRRPRIGLAGPEIAGHKGEWRRAALIVLGAGIFIAIYLSPPWVAAVDPSGAPFVLEAQGKAAIGLFIMAAIWWVFEVVPVGITSIAIGVIQALFMIRPDLVGANQLVIEHGSERAFKDFMHPSVWFIIGSIVIGMVFTKTGITRRLAYKILDIVGERTSMIYLGCFVMTAALTHVMAHTAVAATVYPLMMAIYHLYDDTEKPTRFGKGLFIGMAYVAGAGSIITLLGAARGAVALGFYQEITGQEITFFELSRYMFPLGWAITFLLWGYIYWRYRPEHARIPGLRERVRRLSAALGPMSRHERMALVIVGVAVVTMSLSSFVPELHHVDKSAIVLTATLLFFLFRILEIRDLEMVSWNIVLLFGGAMSLGSCLVQTGAADWLAVNAVGRLHAAPGLWFVLGLATFTLLMTNLIMNVAAIAVCLPVALKMAPYLGVNSELILFVSLAVAGMPFLLLVGAAPNAIAYESKQFTSGEFFRAGIPASILLVAMTILFAAVIWPAMGMDVGVLRW